MTKMKSMPGSAAARNALREVIEEEQFKLAASVAQKLGIHEELLGEDPTVLEKGKVVLVRGQFMRAEDDIRLDNQAMVKTRLRTISILDEIEKLTKDCPSLKGKY